MMNSRLIVCWATYAIRVFDGDYETARLQELLYDIDQLITLAAEYVERQE